MLSSGHEHTSLDEFSCFNQVAVSHISCTSPIPCIHRLSPCVSSFLTHLECSGRLRLDPPHTATKTHAVYFYSYHSLSFISIFISWLSSHCMYLLRASCVVAPAQAPYFHQLFFTRENGIVHQAWTLSIRRHPLYLPPLFFLLFCGLLEKAVCVESRFPPPLIHSLNHADASSTTSLKLLLTKVK